MNGWAMVVETWHFFVEGKSLCGTHTLLLINADPPTRWSSYEGANQKANCKLCNDLRIENLTLEEKVDEVLAILEPGIKGFHCK